MNYQFTGILQNTEWIIPGYVHLDDSGIIKSISNKADTTVHYSIVNGYAIPGVQNAHSHAFQYAMIGLTEYHDTRKTQDDFWGWRNAMYKIALSLDPDQMQAIATMLYIDMLKHGYTNVVEFHYLHHQKDGTHYDNISELGEYLISAAKSAGIKITLVPIFYQNGGFGIKASHSQRRFISKNLDDYYSLFNASQKSTSYYKDATIGYGAHSLRAVEPLIIKEMRESFDTNLPFHIHVAEQQKEVSQSINYLDKRPVQWCLDHLHLDKNCHIVHATHLNRNEIKNLARSQANVVLCPSTEGNLADGMFSLLDYQKENGRWSIGTDSHIGINPFQELRFLDYGQRVSHYKRNTFSNNSDFDSGLSSIKSTIVNGRRAMGKDVFEFFATGQSFDALVFQANHPMLSTTSPENLCSTIVYGSDLSFYLGTMVNGKWIIQNGEHTNQSIIEDKFRSTLTQLNCR